MQLNRKNNLRKLEEKTAIKRMSLFIFTWKKKCLADLNTDKHTEQCKIKHLISFSTSSD